MPSTRAFKSGNSQAIRIPAELAYSDAAAELTISRTGDVITIFPTRADLGHVIAQLRAMPVPLPAEAHDRIELPARAWD